ncbi:MAG: hypothetical protein AAF558_04965 [Verrucomicrobiota bacterium]
MKLFPTLSLITNVILVALIFLSPTAFQETTASSGYIKKNDSLAEALETIANLERRLEHYQSIDTNSSIQTTAKPTNDTAKQAKQQLMTGAEILSLKLLVNLSKDQEARLLHYLKHSGSNQEAFAHFLKQLLSEEQWVAYEQHLDQATTSYYAGVANQQLIEIENLLLLDESDKDSVFNAFYQVLLDTSDESNYSPAQIEALQTEAVSSQLTEEQLDIYKEHLSNRGN